MSDWQGWVGRTSRTEAYLDPAQANRMAALLDRAPHFKVGDTLPPAWHWLYLHEVARASELGAEGHPKLGLFMPPVPLPRRMWAGGSLEFHAPLRLGTTVERTSTVQSIVPKHGRTGPLYFVSVEHSLRTGGEVCIIEQQTIVYRELARGTAIAAAQPAPAGADYSRRYQFDSIALFRYSALTFNGHRIHYDADYCREVEGYPNLVVHAPLIATLLLDLYSEQGLALKRFRYRAQSPLFLPYGCTVNGSNREGGAKLWASDQAGGLAMEAEADR